MSLLTNGRHTCQVQRREFGKDDEGRRAPHNVGGPVTVRGMAEPVRDWSSSEEQMPNGIQTLSLVIWRSLTWPGDVHSHILYDGDWYETVGDVQHYHAGRRTEHYRVTLRKLGAT